MKILTLLSFLSILVFITACNQGSNEDIILLRKIKFNEDWNFLLGDNKLAFLTEFDDSIWKKVKIPHDWSIEGEIKENNPSGSQGGFYPSGVWYYRKIFQFKRSGKTNWFW